MAAKKQIAFTTDKRGKPRAYRVDMAQMRNFPIGLDAAKLLVATGQAVKVAFKPFSPRKSNPLISSQVHGKGTMYTYELKGKRPSRSIVTPFGTRQEAIWWPTAAERDRAFRAAAGLKQKNPCGRRKNKSAIPAKVLAGHKRIWGGSIPPGALAQLEKEYSREKLKRSLGKKKNPAKRKAKSKGKRKRNGSELESAAKMYGKFHGKQATKVTTVQQLRVTPSVLADCGRMVDLVVATDTGAGVRLTFKGTRLAVTGNGGQLYFVGGDQAINLRQFPNVSGSKDHVDLGEAVSICYHTSKDFHNFEKSDYEHEFGEEGGARPLLAYDVHSKRLYLVGGDYVVKREGIVD